MTHVVKTDILTGLEEKGDLHFILMHHYSMHIYRKKHAFSQNLYNLLLRYSILSNEIL